MMTPRVKREAIIRLRVTRDGKRRWQATAQAAGLPLSEWLRSAARAAAKGHLDDRASREELARLRLEINRLGANLNQALAMAHSGRLDRQAIEHAIASIAGMREAVQKALER